MNYSSTFARRKAKHFILILQNCSDPLKKIKDYVNDNC